MIRGGRLIWVLGLGAFGLAFSITTTAAYLPPLLREHFTDSGSIIGLILGAEGLFALCLSPVIGPWSDTFETPLGRRRPFMLVALAPMGFCLLLMPFLPSLWTTTFVVLAFFFAYYVYEPPYRGLYPDLLPNSVFGRAQSAQHLLRGIALGTALIVGGVLLDYWDAGPFVLAAFVTTGACGATILLVSEESSAQNRVFEGVGTYLRHSWRIVQGEPDVRRFLIANAAWEGTFAAIRTFVFLYMTQGLGQSNTVAWSVFGVAAAGYVVAALVAGPLGDRMGLGRVIYYASFVYGAGLLFAGLAREWHAWDYGVIFPVAIAGGIVMTLSWGLLFKLMPARERGAISGLATTTKGIGLLLGAPLAGLAIDLSEPYLSSTDGYAILWPLCAIPILAVIPLVLRLAHVEERAAASGRPEPQVG